MPNPLRLLLLFACSLAAAAAAPDRPVILFVHGAWGGGWQFTRIVPPLEARGYEVRRATLTGLGERSHLASPDIGLETHIEDVVNYLRFENLHDVILVGHSYGGMVIAGVADRMPERIARLIYLDAVLPEDGESLMTANPNPSFDLAKMTKDGFVIPFWVKPDKPFPRDVPHPVKTLTDPITLRNPAAAKIPAAYILTHDPGKTPEEDAFAPFAARARARGWTVLTMEADHNPHWRKPEETAALLDSLR